MKRMFNDYGISAASWQGYHGYACRMAVITRRQAIREERRHHNLWYMKAVLKHKSRPGNRRRLCAQ